MPAVLGDGGDGIAFVVSAGLVYEIIAFTCSSPQTAELNIKAREETLMKWVHLGQGLSAVEIAIAVLVDKRAKGKDHTRAILIGGLFAMASAEAFYQYARQSGLKKPGEPTEDHEKGGFVYG